MKNSKAMTALRADPRVADVEDAAMDDGRFMVHLTAEYFRDDGYGVQRCKAFTRVADAHAWVRGAQPTPAVPATTAECCNCGETVDLTRDAGEFKDADQYMCAPCLRAEVDHARAHGLLDDEPTAQSTVLNTLLHGPIRIEVRLEFGRIRPRVGYAKNQKVHELATHYIVGVTELTAAQAADNSFSWAPPAFHRALREFFRTGQPAAIASGLMCAHLDPDDAVPDATLDRAHVTCAACRKFPTA